MKTTWRTKLLQAFTETGDDFDQMICTLSEKELDEEFDPSYGFIGGKAFTAWGEKYVYFPVVYDGSEWVGYAPRNPCGEATPHQGGGK